MPSGADPASGTGPYTMFWNARHVETPALAEFSAGNTATAHTCTPHGLLLLGERLQGIQAWMLHTVTDLQETGKFATPN